MKVSEFEAKLGTVSDAKLRQMLAVSRSQGPEVALSMILSEVRKRGLEDGDARAPEARFPQRQESAAGEAGAGMASATSSYPKEGAGAFGSDAPPDAASAAGTNEAGPNGTGASDPTAPALAPEWLSEETKSGMPFALKALLLIAVVGGILALAWKFTR